MVELKQTYKSRAEAYRLFIQGQKLPVGQTKFYNDAERLRMINQDKSIQLAALLAYVREELQIDPTSGRSLVEEEQARLMEKLDLREKELKVEKLEREHRKDDRDWIHRDKVNEREGALVGQILEEAKYQLEKAVPAAITLCRGDIARRPEVASCLQEALYSAFRNLYENSEVDITFEGEME